MGGADAYIMDLVMSSGILCLLPAPLGPLQGVGGTLLSGACDISTQVKLCTHKDHEEEVEEDIPHEATEGADHTGLEGADRE